MDADRRRRQIWIAWGILGAGIVVSFVLFIR